MIRAFLGRRSQGRRGRGANGSTRGTTERRERKLEASPARPATPSESMAILQRAAPDVGGAGFRPAGADDGEGRA